MSLEEITNSDPITKERNSLRKFNGLVKATVGGLAAMYFAVGSYVLANSDKVDKHNQNSVEAIIGTMLVAAAVGYEIYRNSRMTEEERKMYERNSRNNFPYFRE